jgi:putative endonuclease
VYILPNRHHTVLYTGVTNDIRRRLAEHQSGRGSAFRRKYDVGKLVYLEPFDDVRDAIASEKQLKKGSRKRRLDLIAEQNPTWHDFAGDRALL